MSQPLRTTGEYESLQDQPDAPEAANHSLAFCLGANHRPPTSHDGNGSSSITPKTARHTRSLSRHHGRALLDLPDVDGCRHVHLYGRRNGPLRSHAGHDILQLELCLVAFRQVGRNGHRDDAVNLATTHFFV
jgi:hypothetical protein